MIFVSMVSLVNKVNKVIMVSLVSLTSMVSMVSLVNMVYSVILVSFVKLEKISNFHKINENVNIITPQKTKQIFINLILNLPSNKFITHRDSYKTAPSAYVNHIITSKKILTSFKQLIFHPLPKKDIFSSPQQQKPNFFQNPFLLCFFVFIF